MRTGGHRVKQLLGMKCVFKRLRYAIFCLNLNKWVIFTHLKLWVAVARPNFE